MAAKRSVGIDWLRNVVVHAGGEAAFTIAHHGMSRHGDDRDMFHVGLFLITNGDNGGSGFKPVHFRHLHIDEWIRRISGANGLETRNRKPETGCYFSCSSSWAAESTSVASSCSAFAARTICSSASFHFFCSMASRTPGIVLTPYPVYSPGA